MRYFGGAAGLVSVPGAASRAAQWALVLALGAGVSAAAMGQTKALPDAEIEANVLRALAAVPQLANQPITTTTVFGTVTLSGSATDEAARTLAENTAAKALGVKKVVDELTLGPATASPADTATAGAGTDAATAGQSSGQGGNQVASNQGGGQDQGTAPLLQSDGTLASPGEDGSASGQGAANGQGAAGQSASAGQGVGQAAGQGSGQGAGQGYGQAAGQGSAGAAYPPVGADGRPMYRRPYDPSAPPAPAGYAPQQGGQAPYGAQVAGRPVTIPSGSLIRMRINEGLSSKQAQPGTVFDGIVLNDVVADGQVAIPRGASVQGTVVEAKSSGPIAGKGQLALELNQVTLGGVNYPIVTDDWGHEGQSKTGESVGNAVGLGAFGAVLGAVFGGGPGALLGAAAGGGAGLATSAATGSRQALVPAEAILTFHLVQPAGVKTVSEGEMNRLASSVRPAQQLRRYPPPPPPGYYPQPYYPYAY